MEDCRDLEGFEWQSIFSKASGVLSGINNQQIKSRMRQTCHNGKWILMGKSSRGCDDDGIASMLLTSDYYQKMSFQAPEVNAMDKNRAAGVQESLSRSVKRMSPYCSSVIEANNGHVQKIRAIEKEETKYRVVSDSIIKSDADSCYGPGSGSGSDGKSGPHLPKKVAAGIHRLELHAYH